MSALESRQLLTAQVASALPPPSPPMVSFASWPIVVSQQSDSATITLNRNIGNTTYHGPLQVRVVSEPSSADGVNLPPIDQVVSFPADTSTPFVPTSTTTIKQAQDAYAAVQTEAFTIPIIPGAPIPDVGGFPGEVEVTLDLQVIDGPPDTIVDSGTMQIVAASDVTPPTVTGSRLTSRGIELTFSEPLDPSTAQNVQNYILSDFGHLTPSVLNYMRGDSLLTDALPSRKLHLPRPSRPHSAVYDAATQTVTLTVKKSLAHSSMIGVVGSGVTDTAGNSVGRDIGNGMFSVAIYPPQHARR